MCVQNENNKKERGEKIISALVCALAKWEDVSSAE
jgi:hypothetical protein